MIYGVMGLCKGELDKAEKMASKIGCYDVKKVQHVMNLFKKYKHIIFDGKAQFSEMQN